MTTFKELESAYFVAIRTLQRVLAAQRVLRLELEAEIEAKLSERFGEEVDRAHASANQALIALCEERYRLTQLLSSPPESSTEARTVAQGDTCA